MKTMQRHRGWRVTQPGSFEGIPKKRCDLVQDVEITANFEPDAMYATEAEAWQVAHAMLLEEEQIAVNDLKMLAGPYVSPVGTRYVLPDATLRQLRQDAAQRLAWARAGLSLCPVSPPQK